MNLKLGAEPKKVAILSALLVVAAYLMYSNVFSAPTDPRASVPASKAKPQSQAAPGVARTPPPTARRRNASTVQDWVPTLKRKANEPPPDPATSDPTLRLDLLAKLQDVTIEGGERSLFDFAAAPIAKQPDAIIKPGQKKNGKEAAVETAANPAEGPKTGDAKPTKTPPPPIPFKFYGFIMARDGKRAFFLNGDDIFAAAEGGVIQSRYKVVRIGVNSAVIEDTKEKSQQTIRLEELPTGAGA